MKKILMVGVVVTLLMALTIPSAVTLASNDNPVGDAIADGVDWLADQQNPDGSWGFSHPVSETGLAVLKLADHAVDAEYGYGLDSPFDPAYPYSSHVQEGLNYLFANAHIIEIYEQPAGDPDTNDNGIGVYFVSYDWDWYRIYETSIAMMGIAGSRAPGRVVDVPGSPVDGWTYKDVLQDAVDYLAFGQNVAGLERGGWGYVENEVGWSDQSNTGWATFALGYAESPKYKFACTIPAFVKTELDIWIDVIQDDVEGGSWYSPHWDEWPWINILKTGHLLYMMALVGDTAETPRVKAAVDYLVSRWNDENTDPGWKGWDGGTASYQATFNVMKGLTALGIHEINGIDWQSDFEEVIVAQQWADGSWPGTDWDWTEERILSATWALLTLQKIIPIPVLDADVEIKPETLNLVNQGVFTAFIQLPEGYKVADIDVSTVVCEGAPAIRGMIAGDTFIAKFNTQDLVEVATGDAVTLTVTGNLDDGRPFKGSDTIRVISRGRGK